MNKSLRYTLSALLTICMLSLATATIAQDSEVAKPTSINDIAGRYQKLSLPDTRQSGDKIEVIEFFWYGCPHCYKFEPIIDRWAESKPDYIQFTRIPALLSQHWIEHAKTFYVASELGVMDTIHQTLFDTIHKHKKATNDYKSLRAFFIKQGVSGDDFDQAYKSAAVQQQVRSAFLMAKRYKLTGVPAVIVADKYMTSANLAGGAKKVMEVVNILAANEHAKMHSETQ